MWFVYILRCKDNSLYVGICYDLEKRIKDHNSGKYKGSYTKGRLPVALVYWKKLKDRYEAARREKEIKGWSKAKKLKLINNVENRKKTFNQLEK